MGQIRVGGAALLTLSPFLVCLCSIEGLACASLALPHAPPAVAALSVRAPEVPRAAPAAKSQTPPQSPASGVTASQSQASAQSSTAATSTLKHRGRRRIITGRIVETRQWCGGANPSDEILEMLRKEAPVANKTFYARGGSMNSAKQAVLLQFTTDTQGNFKISLPPGDYCIVEESKKDESGMPDVSKLNEKLPESQKYQLASPNCLQKWWRTCDYNLKVGKQNLKDVVIRFQRTCNPPCILGGPRPI